MGLLFTQTGYDKLTHLSDVSLFLQQLKFPLPHFLSICLGSAEFIGGLFLMMGLFVPLSAGVLVAIMVVALATIQLPEIHQWSDCLRLQEVDYIVLLSIVGYWSRRQD